MREGISEDAATAVARANAGPGAGMLEVLSSTARLLRAIDSLSDRSNDTGTCPGLPVTG
jgi:hypothetical protein